MRDKISISIPRPHITFYLVLLSVLFLSFLLSRILKQLGNMNSINKDFFCAVKAHIGTSS